MLGTYFGHVRDRLGIGLGHVWGHIRDVLGISLGHVWDRFGIGWDMFGACAQD